MEEPGKQPVSPPPSSLFLSRLLGLQEDEDRLAWELSGGARCGRVVRRLERGVCWPLGLALGCVDKLVSPSNDWPPLGVPYEYNSRSVRPVWRSGVCVRVRLPDSARAMLASHRTPVTAAGRTVERGHGRGRAA